MEHQNKDPELWRIAQKRVKFKFFLLIYLLMNTFFWIIWCINPGYGNTSYMTHSTIPWPVWPMVIWGIGVFYSYLAAYKMHHSLAEKEYQKLRNKQ